MEKKFVAPEFEIIYFEGDVITTSDMWDNSDFEDDD